MENVIIIIDWVLFIYFGINVSYFFVFSLASLFPKPRKPQPAKSYKRFAILIPAYSEDAVIRECVRSCIAQQYPSEFFDTVVISDSMRSETNAALAKLPIRLIEVHFENSTKSKSINAAMEAIGTNYDIAVILDADNVIPPNYLLDINDKFALPGVEVVQTHRVAKNLNSNMALLDAISEEINNSIFRLGHANMKMSAALIGSGMAFDYRLFRYVMSRVRAVGGFDRELELRLLYGRKFIHYLPDTYVQDEKIQSQDGFSRQRRRWLSAQWFYFTAASPYFLKGLFTARWDFCDKYFQQISAPRLLLIGFVFINTVISSFICPFASIKWWLLLVTITSALFIAIPRRYINRHLGTALLSLPHAFFIMVGNLFKLRHANKKFIHTEHGIET